MELQQLTFAHASMLNALRLWNPESPSAMLTAALVCSRPAKKVRKLMESRRRLAWTLRFLSWRIGRKNDWEKTLQTWRSYIEYHTSKPIAVKKLHDTKGTTTSDTVNSPWLQYVRCFLIVHNYARWDQFDDIPLVRLVLDYYTLLEYEDAVVLGKVTSAEYMRGRSNG